MSLRKEGTAFGLAIIALVAAGIAAASIAFTLYDKVPPAYSRDWYWGMLLNELAPVIGGIVVFVPLAFMHIRKGAYTATLRAHFARTVLWYVFVIWVLYIVVRNRGNSDFGLWRQVVEWPQYAVIAGIVCDAGLSFYRSVRSAKAVSQGM